MPSRFPPEYVSSCSEDSDQVWQARLELIEVAKRVFPKFLQKLSTEVFPVYSRLAKQGELAKEGCNFQKALWSDNLRDLLKSVLAEDLTWAVLKWADEFHADAEWLILGALRSLDDWYHHPEWRESLHWNTVHERSGEVVAAKPFKFRYKAWEVGLFTWAAYRGLLRRSFEERLLQYERKTRRRAESQGLVRSRRKYSRSNLEWFVLYQFGGMSSGKICRRYASAKVSAKVPEESTVLKGIKAAAKRIGWGDLREPRPRSNRKIQ